MWRTFTSLCTARSSITKISGKPGRWRNSSGWQRRSHRRDCCIWEKGTIAEMVPFFHRSYTVSFKYISGDASIMALCLEMLIQKTTVSSGGQYGDWQHHEHDCLDAEHAVWEESGNAAGGTRWRGSCFTGSKHRGKRGRSGSGWFSGRRSGAYTDPPETREGRLWDGGGRPGAGMVRKRADIPVSRACGPERVGKVIFPDRFRRYVL